MKKNYLLIIASVLSFALSSEGQPILTDANTSPQIGDVYNQQTAQYVPEGASGASVIWDFSDLNLFESSVLTAYTPSESTVESSFPNATFFLRDGENNLEEFYDASTTGLERLGYSITNAVLIPLSNPETFLTYPFTYNTSVSDDFYGEYQLIGFDGIRSGSCTITGDAYGTIILPSGTFTNAIRIKFTEDYSDEIPQLSSFTSYSNTQYLWFIPGNHFPVFSSYTLIINSDDTTSGSVYQNVGLIGLNNYNAAKNFSIYPNPTRSNANIIYELTNAATVNISLVNGIGQIVEEEIFPSQTNGNYNFTFDMTKYSKGLYTVNLKIDNQLISKKLVVE